MKKYFAIALLFGALGSLSVHAQVGAMSNNPDKSAVLDLRVANASSPKQGLLIPNVSLVALNDPAPIVNNAPATGLMIYNTNAALPSLNGQPGGAGFYYWDGTKWCRMFIASDVGAADNLGSHIATTNLAMNNNDINSVNKLSTQTESIAQGTDAVLPKINDVVVANDPAGNAVWRTAPGTVASDNFSFYKTSTSSVVSGYRIWNDIPGISNFTYTAPASGTLVIQGVIYSRINPVSIGDPVPVQFLMVSGGAIRLNVLNGTTLIDQSVTYNSPKMYGIATSGFPSKSVILLQVPVTAGTTYTFSTMCQRYLTYGASTFTAPEFQFGSITTDGGLTVKSYISAFLVKLN